MPFAMSITLVVPGGAVVADQADNLAPIRPGMLRRRPCLDPLILRRNFMPGRTAVLPGGNRRQCAVRQARIENMKSNCL